jgi:hypothetical protein
MRYVRRRVLDPLPAYEEWYWTHIRRCRHFLSSFTSYFDYQINPEDSGACEYSNQEQGSRLSTSLFTEVFEPL